MKLGSRPCLLAYFFCQSTRPELNNAISVLRGLIYMLTVQREGLIRHVQKRYKAAGRQLFEGLNAIYTLREILSDILNDTSLPTTYLLVDALDECTFGLHDLLHIITDKSLAQHSRAITCIQHPPSPLSKLNPIHITILKALNRRMLPYPTPQLSEIPALLMYRKIDFQIIGWCSQRCIKYEIWRHVRGAYQVLPHDLDTVIFLILVARLLGIGWVIGGRRLPT